jgi:hypothetical protein
LAADCFRPVESGDIAYIAANMREADRTELAATVGSEPVDSLLARGVLISTIAWTWSVDGLPAAIFGVAPVSLLHGQGAPWMLGTEAPYQRPRTLVREGRRYVGRMLGLYPHLLNYVDVRNERSVRWLARIGFTVHPAKPFGRNGEPFHLFEMRA